MQGYERKRAVAKNKQPETPAMLAIKPNQGKSR
jgi:hypothetical protein